MKQKRQPKITSEEAFENYYSGIYAEKWPALRAALLSEGGKVELPSPYPQVNSVYELDAASLEVPQLLDVVAQDRVLDMCSAPGGKALALLYRVQDIELTCNELSLPRFKRLRGVLRDHLPAEIYERVLFRRGDASRLGLMFKETFDHVLLDAPCSGERHILKTPSELKLWSEKRGKGLHQRQVALICSGYDCLKDGGSLVYSTCSINPLENDGVIEKLLKKRNGAQVASLEAASYEKTVHGRMILPREERAIGPIYVAKIYKPRNF